MNPSHPSAFILHSSAFIFHLSHLSPFRQNRITLFSVYGACAAYDPFAEPARVKELAYDYSWTVKSAETEEEQTPPGGGCVAPGRLTGG
jgi:hypothetical protein